MRPQLVLLLSALLPVECRMSYLGLRHAAYRGPGVCDLGGLVKAVLLRMMLFPYGPHHARRLTKQLQQVAPRLSPFSFWLLRQCGGGGAGRAGLSLAQQQRRRADEETALAASVDRLFETHQEQVRRRGGRGCCRRAPWRPARVVYAWLPESAGAAAARPRPAAHSPATWPRPPYRPLYCPQVLYSSAAWVSWLHGLPTRHLVAFYIKYLFDSFQ